MASISCQSLAVRDLLPPPPRRLATTRSSWRARDKGQPSAHIKSDASQAALSAIKTPPPPLLPSPSHHPRHALRLHLFECLRAPERTSNAAETADRLVEEAGWPLPQLARREGGLWMIPSSRITQLKSEARFAGRGAALDAPYDRSPLLPLYATAPGLNKAASLAEDALCTARLPDVDCQHRPGLPTKAKALIEQGMAVVLRGGAGSIFPAGVARWGDASFMDRELQHTRCHVLVSQPSSKWGEKRFKYWRDEKEPSQADRVPGGYEFKPPIKQEHMPGAKFFARSRKAVGAAGSGETLYLQHTLLSPDQNRNGQLSPTGSFGSELSRDLSSIDGSRIAAICTAGGFGPPARCQLFVGASAAAGARTVTHFDQYDNVFLQLAGRKTFLLFDPLQTGALAPYPIHHPLDRSCRVSLEAPLSACEFPRAASAQGCKVTLGPGDALCMPAYWWHEVITEPMEEEEANGGAHDDAVLTTSLNFWFSPIHRMLQPSLPLSPSLRVEFARQLEFLVCDALNDEPRHVQRFCAALNAQLAAIADGECDDRFVRADDTTSVWAELQALRPDGVELEAWAGLFEYVSAKAAHLLGAGHVRPFAADLLNPEWFEGLARA